MGAVDGVEEGGRILCICSLAGWGLGRHLPSPQRRVEDRSQDYVAARGGTETLWGEMGSWHPTLGPSGPSLGHLAETTYTTLSICFLIPRPPGLGALRLPAVLQWFRHCSQGDQTPASYLRRDWETWLSRNGHKIAPPHKTLHFFFL